MDIAAKIQGEGVLRDVAAVIDPRIGNSWVLFPVLDRRTESLGLQPASLYLPLPFLEQRLRLGDVGRRPFAVQGHDDQEIPSLLGLIARQGA